MKVKNRPGRPAIDATLKKMPINVALPKRLIDWLDEQDESRAIIIERALINSYAIRFDPQNTTRYKLSTDLSTDIYVLTRMRDLQCRKAVARKYDFDIGVSRLLPCWLSSSQTVTL